MSLSPAAPAEAAPVEAGGTDLYHVSRLHIPRWAIPAAHLLLLGHCLGRIRTLFNPMVRLVFLRQVHVIGVMGMRVVALLALAVGGLLITETTNLLGARNDYLYDIISWALVSEAAPLLVAVVVIGRSATVISTELALMKVRGEVRFLEQMRIDPRDYLVLPRVAALTASLLAATFYFQVIAIVGGFTLCALLLSVSFPEQMSLLLQAISPVGIIIAGIKTAVFGLVIGTVACFAGLFTGPAVSDVPRAQITAYMRSLTCVVAIDLLFAAATLSL